MLLYLSIVTKRFILFTEVQLCMSYVGICCTDVHYWIHGGMGEYIIKSPYIPGHEGAGVVSKLGDRVAHLKIGSYFGNVGEFELLALILSTLK